MVPVLPVRALAATPITNINYAAGETICWPAVADTVARVHTEMPAAERATAVVVTETMARPVPSPATVRPADCRGQANPGDVQPLAKR